MRCVRFSQDGRYLAEGLADGTAQIHDVKEVAKQWYGQATLRYIRLLIVGHLSDLYSDKSSQSGIWSVCFSPNNELVSLPEPATFWYAAAPLGVAVWYLLKSPIACYY